MTEAERNVAIASLVERDAAERAAFESADGPDREAASVAAAEALGDMGLAYRIGVEWKRSRARRASWRPESEGEPEGLADSSRAQGQSKGPGAKKISPGMQSMAAHSPSTQALDAMGTAAKGDDVSSPAHEPEGPKQEVIRGLIDKAKEAERIAWNRAAKRSGPESEEKTLAEDRSFEIPGILSKVLPLDNAKILVGVKWWSHAHQFRTLQYWQRRFWEWTGTHWRARKDDEIRKVAYAFLDNAECWDKDGDQQRFGPQKVDVDKLMDALKSFVCINEETVMPGWLDGDPPVDNLRELVAMQNGLLDVVGRRLLDHTPRFWSPNCLEFAYGPEAKAPRFEQFLEEVWPGDEDAQHGVLEMFGLCVTDETKFHVAFMFVGPPRGGRGTMGRVLQGLIGEENYYGGSLSDFGENFGMSALIGKKAAVFSDAHLDGVSRKVRMHVVERIKNITGEDVISINRKYKDYFVGRLNTRLVILTNKLLALPDDSGAVAGRFRYWQMTQQFTGERQDQDLTKKLLAERAGILNMALGALDQLRARGRFVQHESGKQVLEQIEELGSEVSLFIKECCVVGKEYSEKVDDLWQAWSKWASEKEFYVGHKNNFAASLRAAVLLQETRPRGEPGRPVVLVGIKLRPEARVGPPVVGKVNFVTVVGAAQGRAAEMAEATQAPAKLKVIEQPKAEGPKPAKPFVRRV